MSGHDNAALHALVADEDQRRRADERHAHTANRLRRAADLIETRAATAPPGPLVSWLRAEARNTALLLGVHPDALDLANAILGDTR